MSPQDMRLELHKAVIKAVMTRRSLVVVEGKEDLKTYISLANKIKKSSK
ncbi:hypothetical protein RT723_13605 [Psychrosphaera aquimarina]|uniref:DUF4435 domain-containing protein n=1 Tax=Psychrosphaera aquimarina TaxID=2044854 RepID=A0ABU3R2V8_9GAMM|nr:hypothetical protein [Psychrosphaera aquimarina]MDU0114016.1 hypothetical protein [Psychrosphaera aquimarina]